ncbi:MAG TPA: HAMP domain-containing sensor histidine kinase [Polyangia bacterium]|jgi:signal transduction histidine kinase
MAAHDMSAPLAAIRMHVRAKDGAGSSKRPLVESDFRASLARIDKLAAAAQRMLDDVLAVERLKERPPAMSESLIDAEKVLGEVVAMQAAALERVGCSIFVKRRDGLDRVIGRWNQTSLERLFGNLIQNVVRHAPGAPIEVSFARRDGQLQIRFADGGPGLPVDGRDAGEAFAHSAAGETGHGLGLWIVYRTVAELAGQIIMQTGVGQGLSFDIRLPLEC